MEKITNLGELGQVVKVKDGYARNFLIPQGKAKRATEENKKAFEARRAELEKAQAATLAKAQERGKKLDGVFGCGDELGQGMSAWLWDADARGAIEVDRGGEIAAVGRQVELRRAESDG